MQEQKRDINHTTGSVQTNANHAQNRSKIPMFKNAKLDFGRQLQVSQSIGQRPVKVVQQKRDISSDSTPMFVQISVIETINGLQTAALVDLKVEHPIGKRIVRESWKRDCYPRRNLEWRIENAPAVAELTGSKQFPILAQLGGEEMEKPCERCLTSSPFTKCVMNAAWGGACVGCSYKSSPGSCSYSESRNLLS